MMPPYDDLCIVAGQADEVIEKDDFTLLPVQVFEMSKSGSLCSHIFLVLRDHGVYMYVFYIWKWSSAHALGGVSGVASFIATDERLQ